MGYKTFLFLVMLGGAIGCGDEATSSNGEPAGADPDTTIGLDGLIGQQDSTSGEDGVGQDPAVCLGGCDDSIPCTVDMCEDGVCVSTHEEGTCQLDGVCYGYGELHPTDGCLVCEGSLDVEWASVFDGLICDDGNPCTPQDACIDGVCTGAVKECDDGKQCTDDSCEVIQGSAQCLYVMNAGPCDDGDLCTTGEACAEGLCNGSPACDDGDLCTVDFCDEEGACSYESALCEDGDSCTEDSCEATAGCVYTALLDGTGCEAGDYCSMGDVCQSGVCVEGSIPVDCGEDGNPCTDDLCLPDVGCVYALNNSTCDDGYECTDGDVCVATVCMGSNTPSCKPCGTVSLGGLFMKATVLRLGENGYPGEGLDVDGNPDTCAPAIACSDGIDNALGVLSYIFNESLELSINSGAMAPLVELKGPSLDGAPFDLAIYNGVPDPQGPANCDYQSETCEYLILQGSLKPDCKATLELSGMTINSNQLIGGGPDTVLVMGLPLSPDEVHHVFIVGGRVEAQVQLAEDGETIIGVDGVVAGAVPKDSLLQTISTVDPSYFPGLTLQDVLDLVDALVVEDIDLDGDGVKDAASVGIRISTIPGIVNGVDGE